MVYGKEALFQFPLLVNSAFFSRSVSRLQHLTNCIIPHFAHAIPRGLQEKFCVCLLPLYKKLLNQIDNQFDFYIHVQIVFFLTVHTLFSYSVFISVLLNEVTL